MKKRKQQRRLNPNDNQILKFLWRWKVANTLALKTFVASKTPFWTFYERIQKLKSEGYVVLSGQGEIYKPNVWMLTRKGFDEIYFDIGEPSEKRFMPQSIPHDAWVLAFQMGNYVYEIPKGVVLCSEQQFRGFDESLLPAWLPTSKKHVPDGFNYIANGDGKKVYGIEVELNLKSIDRYDDIAYYYDRQNSVDHILWLVSSETSIARILGRFKTVESVRIDAHNFILFEEFRKFGWSSKILVGDCKDFTVEQLMSPTMHQVSTKLAPIVPQRNAIEIFLSTARSPRMLSR